MSNKEKLDSAKAELLRSVIVFLLSLVACIVVVGLMYNETKIPVILRLLTPALVVGSTIPCLSSVIKGWETVKLLESKIAGGE